MFIEDLAGPINPRAVGDYTHIITRSIHARATETFVALAKPVDQLLTKSLRAVA
jgi:hypothetical protein